MKTQSIVNYQPHALTTFLHPSLLTSLLLLIQIFASPGLIAAELRIGAAQVKITPPNGIPLAGYYHERGADGVLDDLYCKALVLEQDGERAAFVCLDLISTTRNLVDRARAEIEAVTKLKGAGVMISATHAHTGPELANRGRRSQVV